MHCKNYTQTLKKTNRMRQLLQKTTECNWTEREEEDFNEIMKNITEIPCLAHFARDRDNLVSTDASRTGLGITLWQKQNVDSTRPISIASRYLNDVEIKYSIGELLAVVWGLEKIQFHLYGKVVHLFTDHQASEPLTKRNQAHRQNTARLTRWLDKLADFDVPTKHTAGKN